MLTFQRHGTAQHGHAMGVFGTAFTGFGAWTSTTVFVIFGAARSLGRAFHARVAEAPARARSRNKPAHAHQQEPER